MAEQFEDQWWETHSPNYDKDREQRLRAALMALIVRDVDFTLDARTMGLRYTGEVDLKVDCEEQEDEPFDMDWFFTLEGPGFRIESIAISSADIALENNECTMLTGHCLDHVEGEWAALKWLMAPPLPEARGYL